MVSYIGVINRQQIRVISTFVISFTPFMSKFVSVANNDTNSDHSEGGLTNHIVRLH
jgi:hypothetical protein